VQEEHDVPILSILDNARSRSNNVDPGFGRTVFKWRQPCGYRGATPNTASVSAGLIECGALRHKMRSLDIVGATVNSLIVRGSCQFDVARPPC
jgi:hypothetical protein